ncbi:MAG TPA: glycosyl hydrolase [Acidobacteriota bacterium]|nr:glycosyl hydrolase [Acidobacteriota bacterium]
MRGYRCAFWIISALAVMLLLPAALWAQQDAATMADYDEALYKALRYRPIGPFRGGRSAAVTGVPGKPMLYYFGSTGGGVWRTQDGGSTWENLSDGYFGGSIGAVAVSEWDPNVIYVGGGEVTVRGNVSPGTGLYKSLDAGKTWTAVGLKDSQHIPRIRIHPRNPDLVYAAVMGHLFGPNQERGVYRSKDGGENWERILFANEHAGAVDLVMDPNNPRVLYASTWRILRTPYSLESGGEGSGLWKSTDGGDNWTEITRNEGLPQGTVGIIGVTVSPVDSNRVWAIIEADDGGVFRSEDGGETWRKINDERKLRQRAWYYTRIYAGTQDIDEVYVLNVRFWHSKDGGETYESISTPHGDHHDLWIAPEDSKRMVIGDDGGAQVTFNGGRDWSTYHNQPTAQFYRVTTDNAFPYRIYGAQQDNSTVRIRHRSEGGSIDEDDWESTAGGESGHIAPHPDNPDIVYGGSYGGFLIRVNHDTGEIRNVNAWPDNPMGHCAADLEHRFQWNFPIFFSPHDPDILYTASQVLFKTTDEGQSWEAISPDLTRNDKSKLGPSGGPITKDNTSVEYYATIFAALESPHEAGVLWAGSDDGLVHISRDGGENWQDVTPPDLPEWTMINSMEAHPSEPGGLYFAGTRYKLDDFTPYLYKTEDYGQTWTRIDNGIPRDHFTRVVRADPGRPGLLYAGTEFGMYISFDDGANWKSFQLNLPGVPITDLALKNDDLVVATQGRSFWVVDDLTPLHQLTPEIAQSDMHLFKPRASYKMGGGRFSPDPPRTAGQNAPSGVVVRFYLEDAPDAEGEDEDDPEMEDESSEANGDDDEGEDDDEDYEVKLEFLEEDGDLIRAFSSKSKERGEQISDLQDGLNEFVWNTRYPDAEDFRGLIMWAGSVRGPQAPPGNYRVRLTANGESQTQDFEILPDPRSSASPADFQKQFDFLVGVRDKVTETHLAIRRIREIRSQINTVTGRLDDQEKYKDIHDKAKSILADIKAVEEALYQTKNRARQDPLNFPIRLNNKLAALTGVVSMGDYPPTEQAIAVRDQLVTAIDAELAKLKAVVDNDLPDFNKLVKNADVPAVVLEEE